ncbi:DUF4446 family protein [Candidatus Microgenomates bacterium]|nr:DUF4446 family protein [Candidatus Microgenomates bacterium]
MFNFSTQILSIGFCFLIAWLLVISFFLYKNIAHYNRLLGKDKKESLKGVLDKILKEAEISKEEIKNLQIKTERIEKDGFFHIQKVGLIKFNPFKDIGGKQSFILSLLDGKNNGVLITSFHGRETTRWYVKKVKEGKGVKYDLSKEEIEVIQRAGKV